jgi:hypothetical protein
VDQNCTDTISFAGFGTGILAISSFGLYPEAITTSEKLEMTGNRLLFQILREEFENVSDK